MPPAKPHRRPSFLQLSSGFLPGLAALAVAAGVDHPLRLIPWLLGNTLIMAAVCHAIGFDPEPSLARSMQRRGLAYLGILTLVTALIFALMAWPLLLLSQGRTSLGWPLLGAGLLLSLLLLLRLWPIFGLIYLWDDAYPAQTRGSSSLTAIRRSLLFGWHLSGQPYAWLTGAPAALASLILVLGVIGLSGLRGLLPWHTQLMVDAAYGLVLLPLGCLLIANRTLRLLLNQPNRAQAPAPERQPAGTSGPIDAVPPSVGAPVPTGNAATVAPQVAPVPAPRKVSTPEQAAALLAAVRQADLDTALQLLHDGADPNARPLSGERDQRPALMLAALLPDTRLLRALIAAGADVNQRSGSLTPLLAATRDSWHGRAEAVLTLLSNGADSQASDQDGNTPLHGAARAAEPGVLAMLLDAGAQIDQLNREGESALVVACRAANWAQAGFLLERHAKLAPADGVPALVAAAGIAEDDPDGVQLLLKHRASVNAVDRRRRSALMEAASERHERIAALLLDAGIKVQMTDQHGTTALMEAARSGATGIVQRLVEAQADARLRDQHGRDALMLACQSQRATPEIVRLLLVLGADPVATGQDGMTALDHAAANGRWDLVAQIDPQASLPASLARAAGESTQPDFEQLQEALHQGRWADLAALLQHMPLPRPSESARLYLELARPRHRQARRWLLAHGLPAEARLEPVGMTSTHSETPPLGRRLFDALLQQLPEAADAVADLLDAGASPAGRGLLAQALQRMGRNPAADQALLRWIESGADLFGPDEYGHSPLQLAAMHGHPRLLEALLARGCDPNHRDQHGQTPLFAAVQQGPLALPMVRSLIRHGADPERIDGNGETPLGLALEAADIEPWLNWSGWPLPGRPLRAADLPEAAARGAAAAVQRLLDLGFAVDSRDDAGATALMHASGSGHVQVVSLLLAAGSDASLTARNGMTALATSIRGRRENTMRRLLEAGVAVDQHLPEQTTALMLSAALGYPELSEALLQAGADLAATDAHGRSALHFAAQFSFDTGDSLRAHRLLEQLIRRGAAIDLAEKEGMTPLLLLLGAHRPPGTRCDDTHLGALLPVLLDAGADISHADSRGVTALHACAIHALLAPARILLARGADRQLSDRVGRTAAEVAQRLGYVDIAHELSVRTAPASSIPSVRQTLRQPASPPGP
ncbi:ankyrin repeat domain-containing protein [Frateuria aurantia]